MTMKITRELHGLGIDPEFGYKMVFLSRIENHDEERCDITVPIKPGSFEYPSLYPASTGERRPTS